MRRMNGGRVVFVRFVLHPFPIYILVKDLSGLSVFHMLLIINLAASFACFMNKKTQQQISY